MWTYSYSSRLQLLFELTEATVFNLGWLCQSSSINYYRACIVTSLRPFAHPVACCWMLLRVVVQSLKPVKLFSQQLPWSPKHSATMLDPFAQLFQHCWGHARSLRMVYKDLWVVSFPRCTTGPKIVESCFISLHHCQHARNNSQHCWELLRPFARSLRRKV